ncbi:MAG: hypothetical protein IKN54_06320 [Lachnospiraceae bacterium]|nr:hypothetical protein [Lachnospiraceae bacterium]
MKINKAKLILGLILMIVTGIVDGALMYAFQKDTINLVAVILFIIVYIKGIRDEVLVELAREKIPMLAFNIVGFILMFVGCILMPKTVGSITPESVQGLIYSLSFFCWTLGLICLDFRYK